MIPASLLEFSDDEELPLSSSKPLSVSPQRTSQTPQVPASPPSRRKLRRPDPTRLNPKIAFKLLKQLGCKVEDEQSDAGPLSALEELIRLPISGRPQGSPVLPAGTVVKEEIKRGKAKEKVLVDAKLTPYLYHNLISILPSSASKIDGGLLAVEPTTQKNSLHSQEVISAELSRARGERWREKRREEEEVASTQEEVHDSDKMTMTRKVMKEEEMEAVISRLCRPTRDPSFNPKEPDQEAPPQRERRKNTEKQSKKEATCVQTSDKTHHNLSPSPKSDPKLSKFYGKYENINEKEMKNDENLVTKHERGEIKGEIALHFLPSSESGEVVERRIAKGFKNFQVGMTKETKDTEASLEEKLEAHDGSQVGGSSPLSRFLNAENERMLIRRGASRLRRRVTDFDVLEEPEGEPSGEGSYIKKQKDLVERLSVPKKDFKEEQELKEDRIREEKKKARLAVRREQLKIMAQEAARMEKKKTKEGCLSSLGDAGGMQRTAGIRRIDERDEALLGPMCGSILSSLEEERKLREWRIFKEREEVKAQEEHEKRLSLDNCRHSWEAVEREGAETLSIEKAFQALNDERLSRPRWSDLCSDEDTQLRGGAGKFEMATPRDDKFPKFMRVSRTKTFTPPSLTFLPPGEDRGIAREKESEGEGGRGSAVGAVESYGRHQVSLKKLRKRRTSRRRFEEQQQQIERLYNPKGEILDNPLKKQISIPEAQEPEQSEDFVVRFMKLKEGSKEAIKNSVKNIWEEILWICISLLQTSPPSSDTELEETEHQKRRKGKKVSTGDVCQAPFIAPPPRPLTRADSEKSKELRREERQKAREGVQWLKDTLEATLEDLDRPLHPTGKEAARDPGSSVVPSPATLSRLAPFPDILQLVQPPLPSSGEVLLRLKLCRDALLMRCEEVRWSHTRGADSQGGLSGILEEEMSEQ